MKKSALIVNLIFLIVCINAKAQDTIIYKNSNEIVLLGNKLSILEDTFNRISFEDVMQCKEFKPSKKDVPNMQVSASSFWIRFTIINETEKNKLCLKLAYPTIDSVFLYAEDTNGNYSKRVTGEFVPYYKREHKHQNYIFDIKVPNGKPLTFYMKVNASEQYQLPLSLGTIKNIDESIFDEDLIFGIYFGIVFVMFFYNLFLLLTVKDVTYLYYIIYIFFVGFTQSCLQGYAPRFLYPNSYFLANFMNVLMPAFVGIFAIVFLQNFMQVKKHTPYFFKVLILITVVYVFGIFLGILGEYRLAANLLQMNVAILALVVIAIGIRIMQMKYRPAYFFMIAWTVFIASVVVFVLKNYNVLPYNSFTNYSMQIGSSIEVILLSFALADRINIYRKEREESQRQTQLALQENVRIIKEQNIILDQKVNERTHELKIANQDLNTALTDLKEAETQLVESEKMASLGQLTAGIAHEINNPINFVTANVKPLNRDVMQLIDTIDNLEELIKNGESSIEERVKKVKKLKNDIDYDYLKMEIELLLKGINEGATRTAEIVKGLRVFSRLDEDSIKKADINEGLDSTIIIINNLLNNNIIVVKKYSNLPPIDCYPGKLNQVFLNIISNAIYAIKKKFENEPGGVLTIKTYLDEDFVYVSFADNGIGMDERTKKKLFEPFFTTKDVGEGTGLGLSIAYNTINKHNGQIIVTTELGIGTEFIIKLPIIL